MAYWYVLSVPLTYMATVVQISNEVAHSLAFQHEMALLLQLRVRRGPHLVDDALTQLALASPSDYKKPLMVRCALPTETQTESARRYRAERASENRADREERRGSEGHTHTDHAQRSMHFLAVSVSNRIL
jgi:hypothetical protein